METQIVHDFRQNKPRRVVLPVLQHGTDLLHYITYDNPAGAKVAFLAHWHPEYEIILLLDGCLEFVVDGRLYRLNPDEALFLNSDTIHGHADFYADYGRYFSFTFGEDFIFPDPKCYIYNHFFMPLKSGKFTFTKLITGKNPFELEILEVLKSLRFLSADIDNNALSIQISLLRIFEIMMRENAYDPCPVSAPAKKDFVKTSLWYINENYTSKLSIKELSKFLNVSPDHFRRLFRQATGTSPKDYILELIIRHALCEMESDPWQMLAEIATRSGFDDPNYFARIFRSRIGVSPSDYQKIIRNGLLSK